MTKVVSKALNEEVIEFVNYQVQLLSSLSDEYPNFVLYELPRSFEISSQGDIWQCRRHGNGIWFEHKLNGVVIDVHKNIESPATFDAWRLSTFLESKKIEKFSVNNIDFGSTEREVKSGLKLLVDDNLVEVDLATKLFSLSTLKSSHNNR